MNERQVAKYLKAKWASVSADDVVLGGLRLDRTPSAENIYATFSQSVDETEYQSDGGLQVIYNLSVEVRSRNPTAVNLEDVDGVLNDLFDSMTPGDAVGTGALIFAWRVPPDERSFETQDDRDENLDAIIQRGAVSLRVQWR